MLMTGSSSGQSIFLIRIYEPYERMMVLAWFELAFNVRRLDRSVHTRQGGDNSICENLNTHKHSEVQFRQHSGPSLLKCYITQTWWHHEKKISHSRKYCGPHHQSINLSIIYLSIYLSINMIFHFQQKLGAITTWYFVFGKIYGAKPNKHDKCVFYSFMLLCHYFINILICKNIEEIRNSSMTPFFVTRHHNDYILISTFPGGLMSPILNKFSG